MKICGMLEKGYLEARPPQENSREASMLLMSALMMLGLGGPIRSRVVPFVPWREGVHCT